MIMPEQNDALPVLTLRQEDILSRIIRAYTQNPEPVSSKSLVDEQSLAFSSATVRNEMAVLEEMGYITAPHTSAGRIPTALGYRYFVRGLMDKAILPMNEQAIITQKMNATPNAIDQWMRQAASLLARTASTASIVTTPSSEQSRYKHLELISIQGRLALMVLVLQGGLVHQRMLNLAEPIPQDKLSEVANKINALCADLSAPQMRLKVRQLSELERDVVEIIAEIAERSNQQIQTVYQDGLSDIIKTFPDNEGAQQAVRVYEEPAFLDLIVRDILDPINHSEVQVIIGGDGRYDDLNQLSIVLSRYGEKGRLSGTLGVFGPTNLNYGRAIGTVRYVAGMMTDKLANLTDDTPLGNTGNTTNEENA
jgi:heat-inducible transcriptional repressor